MKTRLTLAVAIALACGCSDDAGDGRVEFATWGEEYIEREIPAADFEDGWSVRYRKFLVVIDHVKVATAGGVVGAEMRSPRLFDLTRPGRKPLVGFALEAKSWEHVSYQIAPADPDVELADAAESDKTLMVSKRYSVYVEGIAAKGTEQKTFAWGFGATTVYDRCEGMLSGKRTAGVVVTEGGVDRPELTIHGDHLFYDDLQSKDAKLRFDPIAGADGDADGQITLEELARVELAAIPAADGPYGAGSASGIHDLGAFVGALSRTLGHFRGEGECFAP